MIDQILWTLTALGLVIVVLTRVRLASATIHAGHSQTPREIVDAHTVAGIAAVSVWVAYLLTSIAILGYLSIIIGWVFAIIGMVMLMRWLPRHSKHAAQAERDSWTNGPWLSVIAHVGVLIGVTFCTAAILLNLRG